MTDEQKEPTFVIIIEQFLSGQWVELIQIEADKTLEVDGGEELQAGVKELTSLVYEHDKIHIIIENEACVFQRADGPVRVKGVDSEELPY